MMSSLAVAALEAALTGAASACAHLVSLLAAMQRYKAALVVSAVHVMRAGVALKAVIAAGSVGDAAADVVAVVAVDVAVVAAADKAAPRHAFQAKLDISFQSASLACGALFLVALPEGDEEGCCDDDARPDPNRIFWP